MECGQCGKELPEGTSFCTACGAEVAGPPDVAPGDEGRDTRPVPTAGLPAGYVPPPKAGRGTRKTYLVIAIVAAVLVILGTAGGLIAWKLTSSAGPVAEIVGIRLLLESGESADLEDVPLDEDLEIEIAVKARYGEEGEAQLHLLVTDGAGDEVWEEDFEVASDDEQQVFSDEFYLRWSEGETFTAEAEITVTDEGEELSDTETLEFYVAEGIGAELSLEEAKDAAEAKLDEANDALVDLVATTGVEAEDLVVKLAEAYTALEEAEDEEEVASVYATGEEVLAECATRKAAWEEEQSRGQEEEQQDGAARQADIAACQQAMFDYAWQTMTEAEPLRIDNFWMNDARTEAGGTMVGMVTAHTDPDRAGEIIMVPIKAQKQGGQWVASFVSS